MTTFQLLTSSRTVRGDEDNQRDRRNAMRRARNADIILVFDAIPLCLSDDGNSEYWRGVIDRKNRYICLSNNNTTRESIDAFFTKGRYPTKIEIKQASAGTCLKFSEHCFV